MKHILHSKSSLSTIITVFVLALTAVIAQAEEATLPPGTNPANHAIFPAKNQGQEQQLKDQLAAYNWATQQTGWDPL